MVHESGEPELVDVGDKLFALLSGNGIVRMIPFGDRFGTGGEVVSSYVWPASPPLALLPSDMDEYVESRLMGEVRKRRASSSSGLRIMSAFKVSINISSFKKHIRLNRLRDLGYGWQLKLLNYVLKLMDVSRGILPGIKRTGNSSRKCCWTGNSVNNKWGTQNSGLTFSVNTHGRWINVRRITNTNDIIRPGLLLWTCFEFFYKKA